MQIVYSKKIVEMDNGGRHSQSILVKSILKRGKNDTDKCKKMV